MMEDFKEVVAWALSPLVMAMLFLFGAWGVWLSPKRRRFASYFWMVASVILLVGSLPVLSYERNRARDYVYAPLKVTEDLAPDRRLVVVVLGTGYNPDPWLPGNSQVSPSFHARFLEGVRIFRSRPDAELVVSVANPEASREEKARFLSFMTALFALDESRVSLVSEAESTADEASLAGQFVEEGDQIVLATSAGHMPRAMEIFSLAGHVPLAAPCDFSHPRQGSRSEKLWKQWIPSEGGAGATRQMLYETVSLLWEKIKG
jgi:uncharacterized SAM-binding protein YcdF (DUF218 family)